MNMPGWEPVTCTQGNDGGYEGNGQVDDLNASDKAGHMAGATQRITPKLNCKLQVLSFTQGQCWQLSLQVRRTFLPKIHMNHHMPDAVIFGPLEYRDMEMVEIYSLQDQLQLESIPKQVQWGGAVRGAIGVTLNDVQLASGYVQPVMEVMPSGFHRPGVSSSVKGEVT